MSLFAKDTCMYCLCPSKHWVHFMSIKQFNRCLYKESTPLHATHDAGLLKKVEEEGTSQAGLSKRVLVRLQAGAFLSLCHHLRERSDAVQNMELMTTSGFCRNCLAKVCLVTFLLHFGANTLHF